MGEDGEGFPLWVAVSKRQQWPDCPSLAGELSKKFILESFP